MVGRGRRREQSQTDVPADWESDFTVTSQASTRHIWDICSMPGTSQGHGRHKSDPQGAPHHLRQALPLKKGRRERADFLLPSEFLEA